jgi:MFS family permease
MTPTFDASTANGQPASRMDEWRRGWPVVAAGIAGMVMMSMHLGFVGPLMKPLEALFGWSRAQISAGLLIMTVIQCLVIPAGSTLLNRISLRKIAIPFAVLFIGGLVALAFCTSDIMSWYFGWAVLGLGVCGIGPVLWTTAVARCFEQSLGLALSTVLSGTGISTLVLPIVCTWLYGQYGLPGVFLGFAAIAAFLLLPLIVLLTRRSEFARPATGTGRAPKEAAGRMPLVRILTQRNALTLLLSVTLVGMAIGSVATHLLAMLEDAGASPIAAAAYFAFAGPSLIVGRIAAGYLLDHLDTKLVATVLLLLPAATCLLLVGYSGSAAYGIVICIFFGLGYGAELDLFSYLCARYFGAIEYPLVYSLAFSLFGISYATSGVLAGFAYHHFGNYEAVLLALVFCIAVAIGGILGLKARDKRTSDSEI